MTIKLSPADKQKLPALLDQLAGAVEELLLSGLTTASEATRQTLNVAFSEASRMGLLRLGGTLRAANEELTRFTKNQSEFSASRLSFFLNRSWLLSQALAKALREGNDNDFDRLMRTPGNEPVDQLEVITIGVAQKLVKNTFCSFEFRLRAVNASGNLPAGQKLMWSCVFPLKPGADLPAEAYLHIPQKQKFAASVFLEKKVIVIQKAAVTLDASGSGRISLGELSTVTQGAEFSQWEQFQNWDCAVALERIRTHRPGPFDLEIEMQEEVVLRDWAIGEAPERENEHAPFVFPIVHKNIQLEAAVSSGAEGAKLLSEMHELRKTAASKRKPLFGLMHYEKCRMKFQPLSVFNDDGPKQLMLTGEKFNKAVLLRTLF